MGRYGKFIEKYISKEGWGCNNGNLLQVKFSKSLQMETIADWFYTRGIDIEVRDSHSWNEDWCIEARLLSLYFTKSSDESDNISIKFELKERKKLRIYISFEFFGNDEIYNRTREKRAFNDMYLILTGIFGLPTEDKDHFGKPLFGDMPRCSWVWKYGEGIEKVRGYLTMGVIRNTITVCISWMFITE